MTPSSFRPIINLGLSLSMMRNGNAIVARALETGPEIEAVHTFNPSGIIVYSTMEPRPEQVPRRVQRAMWLSDEIKWSTEAPGQIYSGFVAHHPYDDAQSHRTRHGRCHQWPPRSRSLASLIWAASAAEPPRSG